MWGNLLLKIFAATLTAMLALLAVLLIGAMIAGMFIVLSILIGAL